MSPIPSRPERALCAAVLVGLVGCQGSKKKVSPTADAAPIRHAGAPDPAQAAARQRCRTAADGYVHDPEGFGVALVRDCAGLFANPRCRRELVAAAKAGTAEAGMRAINACRIAYCPSYSLAEMCEGKSQPTVAQAKAQFPRLVAEVLATEHGEELGTLDSVAYLMIKPLLPRARAVYVRARPGKGKAVELAIGEDGWQACKTDSRITIGGGADLRSLDGPLLGPLGKVAGGVEPSLVEALIDPDEQERTLEVANAAARFLQRRGMDVVICRDKRRNCPDVVKCP